MARCPSDCRDSASNSTAAAIVATLRLRASLTLLNTTMGQVAAKTVVTGLAVGGLVAAVAIIATVVADYEGKVNSLTDSLDSRPVPSKS